MNFQGNLIKKIVNFEIRLQEKIKKNNKKIHCVVTNGNIISFLKVITINKLIIYIYLNLIIALLHRLR